MPSPALRPDTPFLLLDDARSKGASDARLFTAPAEVFALKKGQQLDTLLATLDRWHDAGSHVAGFLGYDVGHQLEPHLASAGRTPDDDMPLAWFGRFSAPIRIAADDVLRLLPDPAGAATGTLTPSIDYAAYRRAITCILDHIHAGDIYQANLTFNASVQIHGSPLALYARIRQHARAGYGGIVFTGTHWLLSFSPELFFSKRGDAIITRPMKGTQTRGHDAHSDADQIARLANDPKQRAENLMIVDLLRNDLSRIALPGSVAVPALFRVETYPTIHQMVSDVSAQLPPAIAPSAILRALFPCGSITGAPKMRAMDIIAATEAAARGAYTGSMGFFSPDGDAAFNVLIRTLSLPVGAEAATLGLGSGVVADSVPQEEWRECLAKGAFLNMAKAQFDLMETMRFTPDEGVAYLDRHLARITASAAELGYRCHRTQLTQAIALAVAHLAQPAKLRLKLAPNGAVAVETGPLPSAYDRDVTVKIMPLPVAASDIRLRHKSSDRQFYDDARRASGADEVVFVTPEGFLTEGSFTNVFVPRDGQFTTPPLAQGLLPGILRSSLIADGKVREAPLTPADLDGVFYVGNALRGLMRARKC